MNFYIHNGAALLEHTEEHPEGADRGGEATVTHKVQIGRETLYYDVSHNGHPDSDDEWLDLEPIGESCEEVRSYLLKEADSFEAKAKELREFVEKSNACTQFKFTRFDEECEDEEE